MASPLDYLKKTYVRSPGANPAGALAYTSAAGNLTSGVKAGTSAPTTNPATSLTKTLTLSTPHDYAQDILDNPAYKQLRSTLQAQGISDAAHLRGAIQQYLIMFGAVPDLPPDVLANSGLDTAGTATLAAGNPFSTLKQLQQGYNDNVLSSKNNLAARGILNSGETGYQLGRIGQNQAQSTYDATNSLLGNLDTLNQQWVAGRQAADQQLATGAFTAQAQQAANPPPPTTTLATYDPATKLWRDDGGNYYQLGPDGSGIPVAMPPANTSAAGGLTGQGFQGVLPDDARQRVLSGQLFAQ